MKLTFHARFCSRVRGVTSWLRHPVNARQNRSYNNHWQVACNGVILHITPSNNYKELKSSTDSKELAGIKLRTLTKVALSEMSSKYPYEYSGISYLESDPIPLLWVIQNCAR